MISVIIPTYKRPHQALKAIKSLQKQTFQHFEIILVDNAADPKVKKMIADFNKMARIAAHYISEPTLGWHNANHTGAKQAKGELLFFTNDDVLFDKKCLASYAQAFSNYPQMKAAGGAIKPLWQKTPPLWLKDLIGKGKVFTPFSLMEPYKKFHLSFNGFFFATNMVIRKRDFFSLGGFNPEIFGKIRLGDGETGLNRKMKQKGNLIGYVPEAIVYHYISKDRMSMEALIHWMENAGAIDMYTLFHERGIPKYRYELLKFIPAFLKINLRYWIGYLFFKSPKANFSLKFKLQAARTMAQLSYINRLMKDEQLQKLVSRKNWLT